MDEFENDIFGGVLTDEFGQTADPNYDANWKPDPGVDDLGNTSTGGVPASNTTTTSGDNILSRFLSGNATSGDKALATLGFGIGALASALRNKPPAVKMPKYV